VTFAISYVYSMRGLAITLAMSARRYRITVKAARA
jgi:hypothetical protein